MSYGLRATGTSITYPAPIGSTPIVFAAHIVNSTPRDSQIPMTTSTLSQSNADFRATLYAAIWLGLFFSAATTAYAQLAPEIGYMSPSGGRAGETVEVVLGGYDWTPDTQVFVHDPRITMEIVGPPSQVLVPDPPYWFGFKARGYAWPLAREFKARLTIPADVPPGLIRWQAANANGGSPPGFFYVSSSPSVTEQSPRPAVQVLPDLPVTVAGQIRLIEEIDRYQFRVPRTGPVTLELFARRLGSPLHGMLQVVDPLGKVVLDAADTEGQDLAVSMLAQADTPYEIRLNDHDYAGDRSYVYRLVLTAGPQVLAAYPAGGKRGETRSIEFVGRGLQTGANQIESVVRDVAFPATPDVSNFHYSLLTDGGPAHSFPLALSDLPEQLEPAPETPLVAPVAVTGFLDRRFGTDTFRVTMKSGEVWRIAASARSIGSPLDLDLSVLGPTGDSLATIDDGPTSVDPELLFTAPADGTYRVAVTDRSGQSGGREAAYRLTIAPPSVDFTIASPTQLSVPIGGTAKLTVKATRTGGFKAPITLVLSALPDGLTAPPDLIIPEGQAELAIDLTVATDAPANARLCQIQAISKIGDAEVRRQCDPVLLTTTMKPRIKLTPEGMDDVRKVHRGSTFLAPVLIERLEGYAGEITLEMTSKQQRHRQGLASDEFIVPATATRIEYPIFVPEWMETTKTSRMILNGSVQVADPRGNVRTLLQRQILRIGLLPEGALMKLSHAPQEFETAPGEELRIPLSLVRSPDFTVPVEIALVPHETASLTASPIQLVAGQLECEFVVPIPSNAMSGDQTLTFRARGLKDGQWPVLSETTLRLTIRPKP